MAHALTCLSKYLPDVCTPASHLISKDKLSFLLLTHSGYATNNFGLYNDMFMFSWLCGIVEDILTDTQSPKLSLTLQEIPYIPRLKILRVPEDFLFPVIFLWSYAQGLLMHSHFHDCSLLEFDMLISIQYMMTTSVQGRPHVSACNQLGSWNEGQDWSQWPKIEGKGGSVHLPTLDSKSKAISLLSQSPARADQGIYFQSDILSLLSNSWRFFLMIEKNEYKYCTWWQPCSNKVSHCATAGMPSKLLKASQSWIGLMLTVLDYISGPCKLHKYTWFLLLWW